MSFCDRCLRRFKIRNQAPSTIPDNSYGRSLSALHKSQIANYRKSQIISNRKSQIPNPKSHSLARNSASWHTARRLEQRCLSSAHGTQRRAMRQFKLLPLFSLLLLFTLGCTSLPTVVENPLMIPVGDFE